LLAEATTPLVIGVHVQHRVTDKLALISGVPGTQQLRIALADDARMVNAVDVSLPFAMGYQATPELYLQLDTKLAQLNISDSTNAFIGRDITPVLFTAIYNAIPALGIQAAIGSDLDDVKVDGKTAIESDPDPPRNGPSGDPAWDHGRSASGASNMLPLNAWDEEPSASSRAIARLRVATTLLAEAATPLTIGVHVQYSVTDKLALISGVPGTQQLRIALADDARMANPVDVSLPFAMGYQATPELRLQLDSELVQLDISDSTNAFIRTGRTAHVPRRARVYSSLMPALRVLDTATGMSGHVRGSPSSAS
jgi:hypothetical protein